MPTFVKGDMWSIFGKTSLFLVTTNPIINKRGELVMGRGIAKQMCERFPGAGKLYAQLTSTDPTNPVGATFHEPTFGNQFVGYFMVKDHWKADAKVPIIMRSVARLIDIAPSWKRIDLNFPGIGNGKLKREDILPLLEYLPNNVYVWEYEP